MKKGYSVIYTIIVIYIMIKSRPEVSSSELGCFILFEILGKFGILIFWYIF